MKGFVLLFKRNETQFIIFFNYIIFNIINININKNLTKVYQFLVTSYGILIT